MKRFHAFCPAERFGDRRLLLRLSFGEALDDSSDRRFIEHCRNLAARRGWSAPAPHSDRFYGSLLDELAREIGVA